MVLATIEKRCEVGLFGFLKKEESSSVKPIVPPPAPGGMSRNLPPLPPITPSGMASMGLPSLPPLEPPHAAPVAQRTSLQQTFSAPLPPPKAVGVPSMGSLPPLPPLNPPTRAAPTPVPAMNSVKPQTPPPMPQVFKSQTPPQAIPHTTPAPSLPPLEPVKQVFNQPLPVISKMSELPKISVPVTEKPLPSIPTSAKLRESPKGIPGGKLQKLLEDLSVDDFDLPEVSEHPAMSSEGTPSHHERDGPLFVRMTRYEIGLGEVKGLQIQLQGLQHINEKLGHIEHETKTGLEGLSQSFEYMQRHLLAMDEKLFQVKQ